MFLRKWEKISFVLTEMERKVLSVLNFEQLHFHWFFSCKVNTLLASFFLRLLPNISWLFSDFYIFLYTMSFRFLTWMSISQIFLRCEQFSGKQFMLTAKLNTNSLVGHILKGTLLSLTPLKMNWKRVKEIPDYKQCSNVPP